MIGQILLIHITMVIVGGVLIIFQLFATACAITILLDFRRYQARLDVRRGRCFFKLIQLRATVECVPTLRIITAIAMLMVSIVIVKIVVNDERTVFDDGADGRFGMDDGRVGSRCTFDTVRCAVAVQHWRRLTQRRRRC